MINYFGATNKQTRERIRTYLKGRTQKPDVQNEVLDILADALLQIDTLTARVKALEGEVIQRVHV